MATEVRYGIEAWTNTSTKLRTQHIDQTPNSELNARYGQLLALLASEIYTKSQTKKTQDESFEKRKLEQKESVPKSGQVFDLLSRATKLLEEGASYRS